ncbi:16S rRNA (cytidine(1402)-2'-O)-methyltransferase [Buchnera aphidicola]|uniref:16S rRNA (cytidine(1402)-2'-O)-methyltransferase n=1 Tax=Buchnera aphidicola TaxID=9 RepID=UPI0034640272
MNNGILYIVPTPIGNMNDISYRAIHTLTIVELIVSENIKHTNNLLKRFNIYKKNISLNKHNEEKKTKEILILLKKMKIALVSDSGTPTINDPGYQLIKSCHQNNIKIIPLPGPCAIITALSASGIPSHEFYYKGFFPKKTSKRIKILNDIYKKNITFIFYESCHRILQSIKDIVKVLGEDRNITLAKEMTKKWEKIKYDKSKNILSWLLEKPSRKKGELVIIIEGIKKKKPKISLKIHNTLSLLIKHTSINTAIKITKKIYKIQKNELYKHVINNFQHDKK